MGEPETIRAAWRYARSMDLSNGRRWRVAVHRKLEPFRTTAPEPVYLNYDAVEFWINGHEICGRYKDTTVVVATVGY
jgi:hypothetical protein